jgi:hypothetical protein
MFSCHDLSSDSKALNCSCLSSLFEGSKFTEETVRVGFL